MPDVILRWRIRNSLRDMLSKMDEEDKDYASRIKVEDEFVKEIKNLPIAVHQNFANEQHYEVPADFFRIVLGPYLKYSSCIFKTSSTTLAQAELDMLELYVERSEMKDYEKLLEKVSTWIKPEGKLFVHIFTHKWKPYHFKDDWMAKTFFTGGTMPSHSLLLNFQNHLHITGQWGVSGTHYAKTLDTWLEKMDANMDVVRPILVETYGDKWQRWWLNWRLFFLVCSETFGVRNGSEWGVSHY